MKLHNSSVVLTDAYDIAVKKGFKGTVEEWLTSLKGEKGDKGDQGIQGIQGIQGAKGERGIQGEQGIQGEKGERGSDGYTPIKGVDYFTDAEIAAFSQNFEPKADFDDKWYQAVTVMNNMFTGLNGKADMSDIPEYLPNPNGLTINGTFYDGSQPVTMNIEGSGDITTENIKPIASAKYQNIIASANTQDGGTFYCIKVRPNSFYEPCTVRFKVHAYINADMTNANKDYYDEQTISEMIFTGTGLNYRNTNAIYSTSYRPYYYLTAYRLTKTGFDADMPHYIGVSLYNATNPTSSTLKRDIEVELLEVINGTVELSFTMVKQDSFYSATNYNGITNTDAASAGTKQTGDNNSIDRLLYASFQPKTGASLYGTQLILSADGETYYSICTSRSTAITKACTTQGFRPEHILYYSSSTTMSANAKVGTSTAYDSLPIDFRYSHNIKLLTIHKPVYIKATYNEEDGLYYLVTDNWMTQSLPTEDDGISYILVGYAYSTSNIYLKPVHPVFKMVNGVFTNVSSKGISSGGDGGSTVKPELLLDIELEDVAKFSQELDFKGHNRLLIVVGGAKNSTATSIQSGGITRDGKGYVLFYYTSFLDATNSNYPYGCVWQEIDWISDDTVRATYVKNASNKNGLTNNFQGNSSINVNPKVGIVKCRSTTDPDNIYLNFSQTLTNATIRVYGM